MSKETASDRQVLILAAGKSTRFKSQLPKVLHPLCGKPLLCHVLDKVLQLRVSQVWVVTGHGEEQLKEALGSYPLQWIRQPEQLGTGHALMCAARQLRSLQGNLLVLYGDTPLISLPTLRRLFQVRERKQAAMVLLTVCLEDPTGYGRVLRDEKGAPLAVVEEKEADRQIRRIKEINAGFTCFHIPSLLRALPRLSNRNRSGEYYLTDLVAIFREMGERVETMPAASPTEVLGVNTRSELAEADRLLRRDINKGWMLKGVTLLDPASIRIDLTVRLQPDVTLYPGVQLEGATRVERGCVVHAFSHLRNAHLEEGVVVDHCSVIRDSRVGKNSRIGPFAHLRQGCRVGPEARVGNFVEVKKSRLGKGSKAAHLAYLGDSVIGQEVNIGAGTITCNYDGLHKHQTLIEDQVFIGSDSQLVAPVRVGRGAYVAAGSTITEDVPPYALALARARQTIKEEWAKEKVRKRQLRQQKKKGKA